MNYITILGAAKSHINAMIADFEQAVSNETNTKIFTDNLNECIAKLKSQKEDIEALITIENKF